MAMKQQFLLLGLFFSTFLFGAELPVIYSESPLDEVKVSATGKLLIADSPGTKNNAGVPRDSLAGRLAVNGKEFHWAPSPLTSRVTGGADLLSAVLSGDETVLLLIERVGGAGKVNSTRLILFSPRNRKIIRAVTLANRRISDAVFVPGTNQIAAVQQAQKEFNQGDAVLRIDLRSGRILAQSPAADGKILSLVCSNTKIWYTVSGKSHIYEQQTDALLKSPQKIRTQVAMPRLSVSPDGNTLIVFGQKQVELFNVSCDCKTTLRSQYQLEGNFSPTEALAVSDDGTQLLLIESGKQAVLLRNGIPAPLSEKPAGFQAFFKKDNILLLGLLKHNAIARFDLPNTTPFGRPVVPGKLKPLTRNITWKMFALSARTPQALLVDNRGNITQLEVTKRRWKKSNLLVVDKTGMK